MTKISFRHASPAEWLLLAATVFAVSSFLVHEICSLDVWWQIAYGEDILTTGEVPTTSRYTAAGFGAPYHDSHWLFQVLLALGHRAFGLVGVQLVMICLWTLTFTFCYRACRIWAGVGVSALLTFLFAGASVERFLVRPELFTYLMIAVFSERLARGRFRTWKDAAVFGVLEVIWVNSHGLFVVGPFLVGCMGVEALVRHLRGGGNDDVKALGRVLLLTIAATPVGPLGFASWEYAALLVSQVGGGAPELFRGIGELSPTFGEAARSAPAFWFFVALLVLAALALGAFVRRRSVPPGRLLMLLGMLAAALTGRRNIVVFAVLAAPFVAEALGPFAAALAPRRRSAAFAVAAVLVASSSFYALSGAYYVAMEIPARWGWGPTPSFFPHGLPAKLEEWGFEGQVLNSTSLGGFYVYHGFPERLPLLDTCWVAYDEKKLDEVLAATRRPRRWRSVVDEYEVRGLLLAHTSPEAEVLLPEVGRDPAWRLVYLDTAASFWVLNEPGAPPRIDLRDPAQLPEPRRVDDGIIFNTFLTALGALPQKAVNLERTLAFGPRRAWLLAQLGKTQIQLRRHEEAEKTLRELLRLAPDDMTALNELAFLAYVRGDLGEAERLMVRAVELTPGDAKLRENLERVRAARQNETR